MQHCLTSLLCTGLSPLLLFTCSVYKLLRVRLSSYGCGLQRGLLISFRALDTAEQERKG